MNLQLMNLYIFTYFAFVLLNIKCLRVKMEHISDGIQTAFPKIMVSGSFKGKPQQARVNILRPTQVIITETVVPLTYAVVSGIFKGKP